MVSSSIGRFQDFTMPFSSPPPQPERRQNPQLRQVFERVYETIEPFFDLATEWGGQPLEYLAFQRLCEDFPQLSHEEAHTLVTAARRVYGERHPK
jgi:hypothetical protein